MNNASGYWMLFLVPWISFVGVRSVNGGQPQQLDTMRPRAPKLMEDAQIVIQEEGDVAAALVVAPPGGHGNWGAMQMTGPPDTPNIGDSSTAWASLTEDDNRVWVQLEYEKPVLAAQVHIVETFNPGAVYQVTAVIQGNEKQLWRGDDPTPTDAGMGTSKIKVNPGRPIDRIRVYLDSPAVPGWNEIDAVGLVDHQGQVSWAVKASASSDYSTRRVVEFKDPFDTPEERLRMNKKRLMTKIAIQKALARQMQYQLDQVNSQIKTLYGQLDELEP